jgi:hypothetical protein
MKSVLNDSTEERNFCLTSTQINVKSEFVEEEEKPINTYKTKRRRSNANSENADDPDGKSIFAKKTAQFSVYWLSSQQLPYSVDFMLPIFKIDIKAAYFHPILLAFCRPVT